MASRGAPARDGDDADQRLVPRPRLLPPSSVAGGVGRAPRRGVHATARSTLAAETATSGSSAGGASAESGAAASVVVVVVVEVESKSRVEPGPWAAPAPRPP